LAIVTLAFLVLLTSASALPGTALIDDHHSPASTVEVGEQTLPRRDQAAERLTFTMPGVSEEALLVLVGTMLIGLAAAVRRTA
jgi:hypothetical protein